MKKHFWIKLKENGKILKVINYLTISDCYDCRYKGKRKLIDTRTPCLYSRDRKTWLNYKEFIDVNYFPEVKYPKESSMYIINKYLGKAIDKLFKNISKRGN